jgi:2-methylaconitate cis-trans-isomerase PrpF
MITAGIPTVFVDAAAHRLRRARNCSRRHQRRPRRSWRSFETIRVAGALRMGLIKSPEEAAKRQHTPKVAFVPTAEGYTCRPAASASKRRRCRSAGARDVDGQAAPRDDGHGLRRHRDRGLRCRARW